MLKAQQAAQHADQYPCLDIFARRLPQLELLRPLDVVPLVLHVDAWSRDLQLVHDLHGLELDKAPARQPGAEDILRKLGVWPCGRAERGSQVVPEHVLGDIRGIRIGDVEQRPVDAKDRLVFRELSQDPAQQNVKGLDLHRLGHALASYAW